MLNRKESFNIGAIVRGVGISRGLSKFDTSRLRPLGCTITSPSPDALF